MYVISKKRINNNEIKYRFIKSDDDNLTYAEFLNLLRNRDNDFLKTFRGELIRASTELIEPDITSYFWECVPVSRSTINKPFEFVVINSPELRRVRQQNYSSFREYINQSHDNDVISFPNLSGDATLIAPMPRVDCNGPDNETRDYKDIKNFNDNAPTCQWNSFWQEVGNKMFESLNTSNAPKWLSTHGLGVSYTNVRICNQPKYYQNQEYSRENVSQNIQWNVKFPRVNLTILREEAISEISSELIAEEPEIFTSELSLNSNQWKSIIENKSDKEEIESFKRQVLTEIRKLRESKLSDNYHFQDNYSNWTREQLIAEIERLKTENEELKTDQTLTSSERKVKLQRNQQKLEKLQQSYDFNSQPNNSKLSTNLAIGGTLLATIGLFSFLVIRKRRKNK